MTLCPPNVHPIKVQARGVTLIDSDKEHRNIDRQGQPCTGLDRERRGTIKTRHRPSMTQAVRSPGGEVERPGFFLAAPRRRSLSKLTIGLCAETRTQELVGDRRSKVIERMTVWSWWLLIIIQCEPPRSDHN